MMVQINPDLELEVVIMCLPDGSLPGNLKCLDANVDFASPSHLSVESRRDRLGSDDRR